MRASASGANAGISTFAAGADAARAVAAVPVTAVRQCSRRSDGWAGPDWHSLGFEAFDNYSRADGCCGCCAGRERQWQCKWWQWRGQRYRQSASYVVASGGCANARSDADLIAGRHRIRFHHHPSPRPHRTAHAQPPPSSVVAVAAPVPNSTQPYFSTARIDELLVYRYYQATARRHHHRSLPHSNRNYNRSEPLLVQWL